MDTCIVCDDGTNEPLVLALHAPFSRPTISTRQRSLEQLRKIRGSQSRHWVPSTGSIPSGMGNDGASVGRAVESSEAIATRASTEHYIVECIGIGVEKGVQEAKRWLVRPQPRIVEKRNKAGKGGRGRRSSLVRPKDTLVVDAESKALGRNIGETASAAVEVWLVPLAEKVQVRLDGVVLVRWALPVVGEATGGEEGGGFVQIARRSDRGHKGTGGRELGLEFGSVFFVVALASGTNAAVTGRETTVTPREPSCAKRLHTDSA